MPSLVFVDLSVNRIVPRQRHFDTLDFDPIGLQMQNSLTMDFKQPRTIHAAHGMALSLLPGKRDWLVRLVHVHVHVYVGLYQLVCRYVVIYRVR